MTDATTPEQPRTADLDALLDPENAPAVHGSWQAQKNGTDNALWLSDSDGCSLLVTHREVAALVNRAIEAQARPAAAFEGLRAALALHYITAIECDHDAKTDTVRCNCSVWTGTPQPSVGAAVQEWIGHVLAALASEAGRVGALPGDSYEPPRLRISYHALDVERLARAIHATYPALCGFKECDHAPVYGLHRGECEFDATAIAAAYDAERQKESS